MNTNQAELTNLMQAEIRQNNHQMLEAMQKMLDNSVSQLKRSASESAESQLQEIKKLKYNEPHKFKKRANEDQFKFNSKVIDTMNDAATAFECKDYTRTKDEIKKGELMMAERQKHILLADKSEFGWATVNEYKKHELAADSEDEKRIYMSEQRAKASRKQQLSNKKPLKRAFSSRLQEAATITKHPTSAIGNRTLETIKMGHKPGSCFACGKEGH